MRSFARLLSAALGVLSVQCTADGPASPRLSGGGVMTVPVSGSGGASGNDAIPAPAGAPAPAPLPPVQPGPPLRSPASTADEDMDGFSPATGDCEDGSPQINPGAYDFPGNGHDEDCEGGDASAAADVCDGAAIDSRDPKDGARALGLCRFITADSKQWGVLSARYVQANGEGAPMDARQTGILPRFGVVMPRAGGSMLALSSGVARAPDQAGYTDDCDEFSLDSGTPPDGYPKNSPACLASGFGMEIYDAVALEVEIRVPTNAKSFAFDSNFYTYEYPGFICDEFNDFFVALLEPKPDTLPDGNILFDQDANPVSVNNSLLQVCVPGDHGGKDFPCPQGEAQLQGTGYDGVSSCSVDPGSGGIGLFPGRNPSMPKNAATGWLKTTAPVKPGSVITLRFAIWDTGDSRLDSLALIDHFAWSVETPVIETRPVVPE